MKFSERELNNSRLCPKWTDSRYYGLIRLRDAVQEVINIYLRNQNNKDKIAIDLGCGTMPYRSLFEPHLKSYLGADIENNKQSDIRMDLYSGKVEIAGGSADYIISTQVLEHVESPSSYLKEAYRICKNDGKLILSTHGFWLYHPDPNDYWRWTASGLRKMLKDNGWEVEHITGVLGFAAAALCLFQDAISTKLPHTVFKKPFEIVMQRIVAFFDSLYSSRGREENATLYLIIAKKQVE